MVLASIRKCVALLWLHVKAVLTTTHSFEKQGKKRPTSIIFFRDGVSEGQYQIVVDSEVRAVRGALMPLSCPRSLVRASTAACSKIDIKYRPKLTFVVCGKVRSFRR